jgi:hypothetical protein
VCACESIDGILMAQPTSLTMWPNVVSTINMWYLWYISAAKVASKSYQSTSFSIRATVYGDAIRR